MAGRSQLVSLGDAPGPDRGGGGRERGGGILSRVWEESQDGEGVGLL